MSLNFTFQGINIFISISAALKPVTFATYLKMVIAKSHFFAQLFRLLVAIVLWALLTEGSGPQNQETSEAATFVRFYFIH
jgi:hypothetical protein